MKILVTGAKGFIGKNLVLALKQAGFEPFEYDIDTEPALLDEYIRQCNFVCHLAGINRPENPDDFKTGNAGFTRDLLNKLMDSGNTVPVLITSSIQASLENPYGQSKAEAENLVENYGENNVVPVYIYRLPNVFGKWCKPNYNSVVATFCNNIARGLPITINNPDAELSLVYIDNVVSEFVAAINGNGAGEVLPVHKININKLAELINSFKESRNNLSIPDMDDLFVKKLYATYLSYLDENEFSYPLKMNIDQRGSFTEFLRLGGQGQISVNISKPSIVKGNHWHNTKNEKFLVVSGQGVIRFRRPDSDTIIEYSVCGEKLQVVDIPTGYTHNIENTGDTDMVTIMWANECFDPDNPDTYFLEV